MDEVRRLQYLQAMGVEAYLHRYVLPGALPSVLCDWPADLPVWDKKPVGEGAATPVAKPSATPAADKQALSRLQQDLAGNTPRKVAAPVNTFVVQTVPAVKAVSTAQFQLAIFQPHPACLLLVPAQHTDTVHLQLLKNILVSIALKTDVLAPQDNFVWPPRIPGNAKVDGSLHAARETLHSLLEGYQHKNAVKHVLVFGGDLATQLFTEETCPQQILNTMQLWLLPTLQQMLEEIGYKKITWQKIRDLTL